MKTRAVTVHQSDGFSPTKLADYIGWLQNTYTDVPPEHRHTAQIEISGSDDYGPCTTITYTRPMTKDEQVMYDKEIERQRRIIEMRERATYEKLKAKFQP